MVVWEMWQTPRFPPVRPYRKASTNGDPTLRWNIPYYRTHARRSPYTSTKFILLNFFQRQVCRCRSITFICFRTLWIRWSFAANTDEVDAVVWIVDACDALRNFSCSSAVEAAHDFLLYYTIIRTWTITRHQNPVSVENNGRKTIWNVTSKTS